MFSAQTGAELLKAILKSTLVGSVAGFYLWHKWPEMMRLMAESPITAMGNALDLVGMCALLVVLGVIPMVGFDVFQIYSHLKSCACRARISGTNLSKAKVTRTLRAKYAKCSVRRHNVA